MLEMSDCCCATQPNQTYFCCFSQEENNIYLHLVTKQDVSINSCKPIEYEQEIKHINLDCKNTEKDDGPYEQQSIPCCKECKQKSSFKKNSKKIESPKQECPKQECPKQECPKQECPKLEYPKQEYPKQEFPKQRSPKKQYSMKEYCNHSEQSCCDLCCSGIPDGKSYCCEECTKAVVKEKKASVQRKKYEKCDDPCRHCEQKPKSKPLKQKSKKKSDCVCKKPKKKSKFFSCCTFKKAEKKQCMKCSSRDECNSSLSGGSLTEESACSQGEDVYIPREQIKKPRREESTGKNHPQRRKQYTTICTSSTTCYKRGIYQPRRKYERNVDES